MRYANTPTKAGDYHASRAWLTQSHDVGGSPSILQISSSLSLVYSFTRSCRGQAQCGVQQLDRGSPLISMTMRRPHIISSRSASIKMFVRASGPLLLIICTLSPRWESKQICIIQSAPGSLRTTTVPPLKSSVSTINKTPLHQVSCPRRSSRRSFHSWL